MLSEVVTGESAGDGWGWIEWAFVSEVCPLSAQGSGRPLSTDIGTTTPSNELEWDDDSAPGSPTGCIVDEIWGSFTGFFGNGDSAAIAASACTLSWPAWASKSRGFNCWLLGSDVASNICWMEAFDKCWDELVITGEWLAVELTKPGCWVEDNCTVKVWGAIAAFPASDLDW